jgi:hypothetical protein
MIVIERVTSGIASMRYELLFLVGFVLGLLLVLSVASVLGVIGGER